MAVERDPAGLLERIPELRELAQHSDALAKAIDRGRPHAVYRQLFWMRWLGRAPDHRELLKTLLQARRLFVEPIRRAPMLYTLNGVGSTVYGSGDADPDDGTYVKTLFFVLVFVPIYPFTSYLVRTPDAGQKGWVFIARLPLSGAAYVWQRSLALVLLVAIGIGATRTYVDSRYQQIHVANALAMPVEVKIGDQQRTVPAMGVEAVRVRLGQHAIDVRAGDQTIEQGSIVATRDADVQVWNVLGLGFVYDQIVKYSANAPTTPEEGPIPTVHCGERAISLSDIDYVFTDPPNEVSVPKNGSVTKRHLAFDTEAHRPPHAVAAATCIGYLVSQKKGQQAAEMLARAVAINGFVETQIDSAIGLLTRYSSADAAVAFAERALAAQPNSLERNRAYQSTLRYHGRNATNVDHYKKRFEARPDDADAAYLYARTLPHSSAAPIVSGALAKHPEHPYLLRMRAYRESEVGQAEQCLSTLSALWRVAPNLAGESLELELSALAATGKIDAARARVLELLKTTAANERQDLAKWGLLLSRFDPPSDAQSILDFVKDEAPDAPSSARIRVRIEGRHPIEPKDVEQLSPGPIRQALALELLARTDPQAALRSVGVIENTALHLLAPEVWALLFGEAARPDGDPHALELLSKNGPVGLEDARVLVKYVREGGECNSLSELSGPARAAIRLARTRATTLPNEERQQVLALARQEDALHGVVTEALDRWQ